MIRTGQQTKAYDYHPKHTRFGWSEYELQIHSMKHSLTFWRQKDEKLDGWTVNFNGQTYHDCSLGALVKYMKDLGTLKTGGEYQIVNNLDGTYKTRIA